ncbi:MAG: pilus assembly protein PilM [Myxococcales bacterium]|nr:pilus assembly protein PilM [Myxococcales bacterium]
MPRLIALDIGSHAVKATTYRMNGRQFSVEQQFHQPVPQDGSKPGMDLRMVALATLLEDVPDLVPGASDSVVMAYPSSLASFHRVDMPFTDRAQIEGTLPFTVENEVPFDLEDMVLGWRVASVGDGSQVVAVLARHEQVSDWLNALSDKGVDPAAVYVDADVYGPWGLLESGWVGDDDEEHDDDDEEASTPQRSSSLVAVVDVGHLHTTVTVVRDGVAEICRSINTGGWAFTRAIQEALDCTWEQAEQFKHGALAVDAAPPTPQAPPPAPEDEPTVTVEEEFFLLEEEEEEVTDPGGPESSTTASHFESLGSSHPAAGAPVHAPSLAFGGDGSGYDELPPEARERVDLALKGLLAELRSTLISSEDILSAEVTEVRVTGGSSRMEALRLRMAEDLGVPVRLATDPSMDGAAGPFSLTSALAAASVPGAPDVVDLRVGDLQYRGGTNLIRASLTYGVAGAVFFTFAATLMFGWQFWTLSGEQSQAEAAAVEIVKAAAGDEAAGIDVSNLSTAKALMAGVTEDAAQLAAVVGDGKGVPPTVDTLYALTKAFPPHPDVTVELSDLTITRTSISFNAETDNFASSSSVEERLQSDPRFAKAAKGQETKMSNGRVKFPVSIPIGDGADTEEEG